MGGQLSVDTASAMIRTIAARDGGKDRLTFFELNQAIAERNAAFRSRAPINRAGDTGRQVHERSDERARITFLQRYRDSVFKNGVTGLELDEALRLLRGVPRPQLNIG